MKCITAICAITVSVLSCINLQAEGVQLQRSQWLKKIGVSTMDESILKETFALVSDDEKVEFVQRVMKAVSRMPVEPEKKAATFVNSAVSCIQSAKGDVRYRFLLLYLYLFSLYLQRNFPKDSIRNLMNFPMRLTKRLLFRLLELLLSVMSVLMIPLFVIRLLCLRSCVGQTTQSWRANFWH
jgi:hypothetical protein